MNAQFQTIAALIVVAIAGALLLRSALKKSKKPGCGGECGCPSNDFKANLKKGTRDESPALAARDGPPFAHHFPPLAPVLKSDRSKLNTVEEKN